MEDSVDNQTSMEIADADVLTANDVDQLIELEDGQTHDAADDSDMSESEEQPENETETEPPVAEFTGHKQDVFSIDCTAAGLAASGAQDDQAFIWHMTDANDATDAAHVFHCQGHKDSVTFVRFNAAGTKLATADLSGVIRIWTDLDSNVKLLSEYSEAGDLEWVLWHHTADILFAGDKDGNIWMWLVAGESSNCKVFAAGSVACSVGLLLPCGKLLLAGYEDGTIRLWHLRAGNSQTCVAFGAAATVPTSQYNLPYTCAAKHNTQQVAVFGNELGVLVFVTWANDQAKISSVLNLSVDESLTASASAAVPDDGSSEPERVCDGVESVVFAPTIGLLAAGTVSGRLCLLQLGSSPSVRVECSHPQAISKCVFVSAHALVTACVDGWLRCWDVRDGSPLQHWHAHQAPVFDLCYQPQLQVLCTASADATCKVFTSDHDQ